MILEGGRVREVLEVSAADVDLAAFVKVCRRELGVRLSPEKGWRDRVHSSRRFLEEAIRSGVPVYGVTTGFGYSSFRHVAEEGMQRLVDSLVRQHGCGAGPALTPEEARGVLLARLVTLAKGYSAVRLQLLEHLVMLLERDLVPIIRAWGSVGASGDLTPLSYVAAVLQGEREAWYRGERMAAKEALARAGLSAWKFAPKETLALMNGTAAMTSVAILAHDRLRAAIEAAERATALLAEVVTGRRGAFEEFVHAARRHPGQERAARRIRAHLEGSGLLEGRDREGRLVQDPYSLRCAPQVLGAVHDAADWLAEVLQRELNGVDDNPLVDPDTGRIAFAGNFYGGHVALAMDILKTVAANLADLADRQFALLVDSRFNEGLPETLVAYEGSGIKGLQITCSSVTALAVQRSFPDSVLSRPTEVGNQDKVSMGLNAATNAAAVITFLELALAAELIALSNAAAVRGDRNLSPEGRRTLDIVREVSPPLAEDRRLDAELSRLASLLVRRPWGEAGS